MNNSTARNFIALGSVMAMLSVMIGAFGAHALKNTLEHFNRVDTFETAAKYFMYHSLGIVFIGILLLLFPAAKGLRWSVFLFLGGFVFFCGSLFTISLTGLTFFGAIAPIGGLCFMLGWLLLALNVLRVKS